MPQKSRQVLSEYKPRFRLREIKFQTRLHLMPYFPEAIAGGSYIQDVPVYKNILQQPEGQTCFLF